MGSLIGRTHKAPGRALMGAYDLVPRVHDVTGQKFHDPDGAQENRFAGSSGSPVARNLARPPLRREPLRSPALVGRNRTARNLGEN